MSSDHKTGVDLAFVAKFVSILVSFGANFTILHFMIFRPTVPIKETDKSLRDPKAL